MPKISKQWQMIDISHMEIKKESMVSLYDRQTLSKLLPICDRHSHQMRDFFQDQCYVLCASKKKTLISYYCGSQTFDVDLSASCLLGTKGNYQLLISGNGELVLYRNDDGICYHFGGI